jgi:hypothetical protein
MSRDNLDQSSEEMSCVAITSSGKPCCRRSRTALANASLSTSAILASDPATTRTIWTSCVFCHRHDHSRLPALMMMISTSSPERSCRAASRNRCAPESPRRHRWPIHASRTCRGCPDISWWSTARSGIPSLGSGDLIGRRAPAAGQRSLQLSIAAPHSRLGAENILHAVARRRDPWAAWARSPRMLRDVDVPHDRVGLTRSPPASGRAVGEPRGAARITLRARPPATPPTPSRSTAGSAAAG